MIDKKKSNFDKFIEEVQSEIIEEEKAIYSKKVIDEYNNPKNVGRMNDPDAFGIIDGSCGDTMEFYLKIGNDKITEIMFMTNGCGATIACGSMLTTMVKGKSIDVMMGITKDDLVNALDGLPRENLHCAALAVGTLRKAIINYRKKMTDEGSMMDCALCDDKKCYEGKDCTKGTIGLKAKEMYIGKCYEILKTACHIEAEYYMRKTRIEELVLFGKKMGYKKLGVAFCIGLENEARILHTILAKDFEVYSVCCKVCGIDKNDFGLEKLHGEGFEAACDPIGQALVLNKEETELNIILGLCIGHDILFTEHSKASVTTLAVKDRVLAHNPLGAIYSNYFLENILNVGDRGEE